LLTRYAIDSTDGDWEAAENQVAQSKNASATHVSVKSNAGAGTAKRKAEDDRSPVKDGSKKKKKKHTGRS
jgi:hypothetical protein